MVHRSDFPFGIRPRGEPRQPTIRDKMKRAAMVIVGSIFAVIAITIIALGVRDVALLIWWALI